MNVAILGTRGIPASYSGFETAVEQITQRLTARGHNVTVYCRPHVVDPSIREWKGAKLVHLPTVRNKYLDTFVHTLLSSVHAARRKPDVALFFIAGNSPLCMITRLARHPDGDQRRRPRLRPPQVEPLRQVLPARRRAPVAADGPPRHHRLARGRRDLREPLRPRDRRRPVRRRGAGAAEDRHPRPARPRPARLRAVRRPARAREQPAPARRGLVAHPDVEDRRQEAGGRRRRAVRVRVHQPRAAARRTRACSSPATSSAPATGSCRTTPTCSAPRPRSAAPTR